MNDSTTVEPGATGGKQPELAAWLEIGKDGDLVIARQAELALSGLFHLADCGLRVADGVIYLAGRVSRRSEAEALAARLRELPGVRAVRGHIQCDTDDFGGLLVEDAVQR